ncbi:hypothetical protein CHCC20347_4498 [Bacillus paralicheniformis]|uniref:Cyclic lactone autoinducer peptide n=1 Tax=Bacillus paralicheniformis TaxID=1648923 RepID=A0ABY3FYD2_9BACI|nr:hypothetical protein CHCC20347_4498 [Bacillus paralicheniformis]TWL41768.1 hypothetical protein CHCC15381_3937 [Bacillus paralicheniformis]
MSLKTAPTAEMVNASNVISGKIGKRCAGCTPFFQRLPLADRYFKPDQSE